MEKPCVPPVVAIVSNIEAVLEGLPAQSRLRLCRVDASKCSIEGAGLEHCYPDGAADDDAPAQNVVRVTCCDDAGAVVTCVDAGDVALTVHDASKGVSGSGAGAEAPGGADAAVGRLLRGAVKDGAVVELVYGGIDPDAPPGEVLLSVSVCGHALPQSPFRVPVVVAPMFEGSDILRQVDPARLASFRKHIASWLPKKRIGPLLFSASRDGGYIETFHEKCDKQGATLVLVRSADGFTFGGYTSASWTWGDDAWVAANQAFLFSIASPHSRDVVLFPPTERCGCNGGHTGLQRAIYCDYECGPSFGCWYGPRLHTRLKLRGVQEDRLRSYMLSDDGPTVGSYQDVLGKGSSSFTGSSSYTTVNVEVWSVL